MTTNGTQMQLSAFQALLEAYGAERTRWPGLKRVAAEALLAQSADARRLLAEAIALDQVLAKLSDDADDAQSAALLERIVTKAGQTPRLAATGIAVAKPAAQQTLQHSLRARPARAAQDLWRNAALVAASLLIGLFVGQAQFSTNVLPAFAELATNTIGVASDGGTLNDIAFELGDDE